MCCYLLNFGKDSSFLNLPDALCKFCNSVNIYTFWYSFNNLTDVFGPTNSAYFTQAFGLTLVFKIGQSFRNFGKNCSLKHVVIKKDKSKKDRRVITELSLTLN